MVQLEARYAADSIFHHCRAGRAARPHSTLTQALADRGFADSTPVARAMVQEGRDTFNARVDAAVTARTLTRGAGTRLKTDYGSLVQLEANYLRDGRLTDTERDDLDERLDALDARLESRVAVATPRARLDAIARALPTSRLTAAQQSQLRVEHGDLVRLAAAYERMAPTADERAYLEARLVNLETRAGRSLSRINHGHTGRGGSSASRPFSYLDLCRQIGFERRSPKRDG